MMRYLTADSRWVSTETAPAMPPSAERLVEQGLLHESMLGLAQFDLVKDGIPPFGGYVRLTNGPGGQVRYASYYDVLMTNPWGHGTVHTIARGLARLPLKLYEPDPADDAEPGTVAKIVNPDRSNGPAGKVAWALRYPNPAPYKNSPRSRRALWYSTVLNKLVHGNALWEIRRSTNGIVGFTFHPMESVEMDEDTLVYKIHKMAYGHPVTIFDVGGSSARPPEKTLTPERVVHFGLWEGGRRPLNPSPVRALHTSVALYDAVSRHMVSYFNNGARLSGHMKVEPNTGKVAREAIREEILKLYADPSNTGKVMISSGEWQQFHREPEFAGIVNLIKHAREEIFAVYSVPPPVMGVLDRAIMSNVREMRDQYVRDLIGPHAEFLAGDFESQVIDDVPAMVDRQIFAEFDVDEQLRPDLWKRAASFRNILLAYTPDELRRIERQPAIAGTDADPNGYAATIQRPLNESPLNNLPDFELRDALQERRVGIEERRLEHEMSKPEPEAPAPSKREQDAGDD